MNDYSARDYDSFVAMDVHARSITIATLDTITGETALGRLGGCPGAAEVVSWAGERTSGRTLFAYESGPTKFDLCRGLRELGQDCGVAAVDKVNIKIVNRTTISSSLAQLHNHHSSHRTFTTFDYSSLLLSAGRSLSLYDRPVIFSNVQ